MSTVYAEHFNKIDKAVYEINIEKSLRFLRLVGLIRIQDCNNINCLGVYEFLHSQ